MKIQSSKFKLALLATGMAAAVVNGALSDARADSQGYPSAIGALTNVPAFLTSTAVSGVGSNTVVLHGNAGLAYQEVFQGSNLMTGPVTTWFYPSADGTNYFTSPWATLAVPASGSNTVVGGTNWSQFTLRGYQAMSVGDLEWHRQRRDRLRGHGDQRLGDGNECHSVRRGVEPAKSVNTRREARGLGLGARNQTTD